MNSRERILAALAHKEPDRVPFDLGGTVVTGIQATVYQKLRKHIALPEKPVQIVDILQQIACVDDDILDFLGVDVKNVSPRSSAGYQIEISDSADGQYST
ncbi:hypothetical protein EG832_21660, partial [bacterium]|nr:hypothetical protein [bacterium]